MSLDCFAYSTEESLESHYYIIDLSGHGHLISTALQQPKTLIKCKELKCLASRNLVDYTRILQKCSHHRRHTGIPSCFPLYCVILYIPCCIFLFVRSSLLFHTLLMVLSVSISFSSGTVGMH